MQDVTRHNHAIFTDLTSEIRAGFEKLMAVKTFTPGDVILREGTVGDGCYIIRSGRVMLYSFSSLGERKIFDIITTGDVLGEMAMIDGEPRSMTAECLTDVSADFLAKADFEREILTNRDAILPFLKLVVRRLRRLDQHVEEIIFQGVPSRVATAITYLADRFGEKCVEDGKDAIRLEITHAEIADLVGTSREYTSKFLSQFQRDNLLKCGRGTIDIYDMNGIRSWAK
jgi:CRP/FNR family transcriptional regulator